MCPACALTSLTPLADLGGMPVACGNTFPSPVQARLSPRGQMLLASCASCGHVANIAFDASLAHFDATFEAALFHSPTYTEYATGVVDRLVERYDLAGRRVLEIASGATVLVDRLISAARRRASPTRRFTLRTSCWRASCLSIWPTLSACCARCASTRRTLSSKSPTQGTT
jgi:hypothetical protein